MALVLFILLMILEIGLITYPFRKRKGKTGKKILAIVLALINLLLIFVVSIPAFMFKKYDGRETTGEYEVAQTDAILIDGDRIETFETDGSNREVPIHFYYPANADDIKDHSLPLVIFSHGAFGYYQSNTSTYNELASNGYVVVSLDHPYHSFFTKDTSGKTITVDPGFFQTALNVGNSDVRETEVYDITSGWIQLREDDMNFVIDEIKEAGSGGAVSESWHTTDSRGNNDKKDQIISVLNMIDYDKIGLMGHSLGGATAVTVGRRDDISAVIDLDGTMLGEETGIEGDVLKINEEPYDTPILNIDNEEHHFSRIEAEETGYVYPNNVIMDNATCGYDTYFAGTDHMNFTDLPLIAPKLAEMLGTGTVDAGDCIDKVNSLVLHFLDCYLKDGKEFSVEECY